jgi:hypothetical protein
VGKLGGLRGRVSSTARGPSTTECAKQRILDWLQGGIDQPAGKVLGDPGNCARETLPAEFARLQRVLDRPGDVIGEPPRDLLCALNRSTGRVPGLARDIRGAL